MSDWIHISLGGPMQKISVDGKIHEFEMHPYCGPNVLSKKTGEPLSKQPARFLYAASLWAQQGQHVDEETGLCIWHHPPQDILQHLGGRHYKVIGETEPRRGE